MRLASGVTDQYIYFVAIDSTDHISRKTGLSGFTVYRSRNGAAAAAYTTPTINETESSNMPGVYELLVDEDMTIDSGDETQEVVLHITVSGMDPVTRVFELYRPKITAGETLTVTSGLASANATQFSGSTTAADNAEIVFATDFASNYNTTADKWNASVTHYNGTAGTFASGRPEVNVSHWLGTAAATPTVAGVPEVDVTHWLGTAAQGASGRPQVDLELWLGSAPNALVSGRVDSSTGAMAANVMTAAAAAADFGAEIADAVWDEDATGHQTQGTFGQAIGDPVADTNTIYKAVVTDATGATVGVDAAAILADTGTDGVVVASINNNAITAAAVADGAIDAGAIANGAIDAATFAAGAIDAAALAADAGTEIATAVWASGTRTLTAIDEDSTTLDLDATIRGAVGLASANLDTQLDALPTANENADALLDRANGIETGWTFRQIMRILASVLGGKVSGGGSGTETFRDITDTKDRVTATVDSSGNRTAITLDNT